MIQLQNLPDFVINLYNGLSEYIWIIFLQNIWIQCLDKDIKCMPDSDFGSVLSRVWKFSLPQNL